MLTSTSQVIIHACSCENGIFAAQITITLIGVLRIDMDGSESLEFIPSGRLLRFVEDAHLENVSPTENTIYSLPDEAVDISASDKQTVKTATSLDHVDKYLEKAKYFAGCLHAAI